MPVTSVQRAHDELLASSKNHDAATCPLCQSGAGFVQQVEEVAVAEAENTYTEAQLQALIGDAVSRETTALTQANTEIQGRIDTLTAEKADLEAQITGLEAEKAAAETAKSAVERELAEYKTEIEHREQVATLVKERVAAIKTAAGAIFEDDYYTDERAAKWAEMAEEAFAGVLEAVQAAAKHAGREPSTERETAAFTAGKSPTEVNGSAVQAFLAAGRSKTPATA